MKGRKPKPPELRQRRNKTTTAATLTAKPEQLAIQPIAPPAPPAPRRRTPPKGRKRATAGKAKAQTGKKPPAVTPPPKPDDPQSPKLLAPPALPSNAGILWHPQTLEWWADVWTSPMAALWLAADRHALIRTAVLVNEYWHRPTATLLAEIRQQEARFGLTPMDRHRLQWKIDTGQLAPAEQDLDAPPPPAPGTDPRESLRLIKGGKGGQPG